MLAGVELMFGIEQFGRWSVQEFVARSQDARDVLTYLRAERVLEMVRVRPFMTADLVTFERRTSLPPISDEISRKNLYWDQQIERL